MKPYMSVFLASLLTLLTACSSLETKRGLVTIPSISVDHPSYKTIVIDQGVDKVKGRIIRVAEEENFADIKAYGDTVIVKGRQAILNKNGALEYAGKTLGATVVGTTAVMGLVLLGWGVPPVDIAVGLAPPLGLGSMAYAASDREEMRSVTGIAKLSSINNGKSTEVKLNFNRLHYKKNTSFNPFSDDKFSVDKIEFINDPKIYDFAFKRLQGIKATLPE